MLNRRQWVRDEVFVKIAALTLALVVLMSVLVLSRPASAETTLMADYQFQDTLHPDEARIRYGNSPSATTRRPAGQEHDLGETRPVLP